MSNPHECKREARRARRFWLKFYRDELAEHSSRTISPAMLLAGALELDASLDEGFEAAISKARDVYLAMRQNASRSRHREMRRRSLRQCPDSVTSR